MQDMSHKFTTFLHAQMHFDNKRTLKKIGSRTIIYLLGELHLAINFCSNFSITKKLIEENHKKSILIPYATPASMLNPYRIPAEFIQRPCEIHSELIWNHYKIHTKSIQNPYEIHTESIRNL